MFQRDTQVRLALATLTMMLLICRSAAAQYPTDAESSRVVSGTGTVVVRQMPTTMRVSIQFKETAKDLPEALKSLKDRFAVASARLIKLGATKDSVRESSPSLIGDDVQSARQMARQMAMMNARGGGNKKKKSAAAPKVSVIGTVSAEWPLQAGTVEELLLFVQPLKDQLHAAELGGQTEKKKLSAEEQEEMEEMELMQQQFGEQPDAVKPGEPKYLFLAKISVEDQNKARAAAFQKAHHQAEQLAIASGRKLGKLRGLQSHKDPGDFNDYRLMRYGMQGGYTPDDNDESLDRDDEGLIQSPICGKIRHTFAVGATFDIE